MTEKHRPRKLKRRIGITIVICLLATIALTQYRPIADWVSKYRGEINEPLQDGIDKERSIKLKVIYMEEGYFMQNYGRAFRLRYPNVSFEVLTAAPGENYLSVLEPATVIKMMERESPDVLLMNPQAYEGMAAEGRLSPLDGWIARDGFDLNAIDPGITDSLRQLGGGVLYGLAPEFERMGLFFNLNLFEKQGVPFPKEHMSWVEVLRLASRFPADGSGAKRIHGLSIPSPSTPGGLIDLMGRTNQLKWMDSANEKLTLQTAAWQEVWKEVLDGVKRGAMLWEKQPGKNPFLAGQVAMTLQPFRFVSDLQQQAAAADLSWDVVTEPVHPSNPDISVTFDIPMIFAVNAQSPYAREAWELVKFINSKEIAAKQMRERADIPLLSRRQQLLERVKSIGISSNIDAFYRLKPRDWDFGSFNTVQGGFRKTLVELIDQEAAEVLEGRQSLSGALESLEKRARESLLKSRGEPEN
ncbi:MAG: hypothetical protein K0R28_1296 [Paenibacillus sp.]|jgi:multiple sugar transport system substrate-binding protein|nr:hypothetical protein [Paenibacillus sp.]